MDRTRVPQKNVPQITACAAIVVLLVMGITMLTYHLARPGYAANAVTRPPINAVYLADPTQPLLDLSVVRSFGVRPVSTVPDLVANTATVSAVIIDASLFDAVSTPFLGDQLAKGHVIVGINVPLDRLKRIPGYGTGPAAPNAPQASVRQTDGRLYYSLIYQQGYAGGGYQRASSSDFIFSPQGFLRLLSADIGGIGTGCPPKCDPPPTITLPRATAVPTRGAG